MAAAGVQKIIDWLVDGARSAQASEQVLAELCDALTRAGLPLFRVGVFVRTLHPDFMGRSFIWREGGGPVLVESSGFQVFETVEFITSPLSGVFATGQPARFRMDDAAVARSPLLGRMRDEGVTDYLALPLVFTDGSIHATSWTTRQPGGFTDVEIDTLHTIVPALARVAEIRALRRTAKNLLDTYVGPRAGERILAGQIRRGHADTIHAAIWLSDMRGFTALSDRVPPETVVEVLNRYFDCQVPAIQSHGGEVLKFMGDGLLAIFPIADNGADERDVCDRVLRAAREAYAAVGEMNATRAEADRLRFGVALHTGRVLYGNIGGGGRLDFTCIGPAVNLAARIEKIAGQLGRVIVASADFARHAPDAWEHAGVFPVAGFSAPQSIYAARDGAGVATAAE
jgi:adenylate cyclase